MKPENKSSSFGGIGQAYSDRNFRFYSIGAIATWIGYFVQLVAVSWYAWELTESTTWLASIALLDIAPNVFLMPLAGAVADRYDKYWLMGVGSFLALVQAIVIAVLAWTMQLTIWPLAILVLIHGVIISFMVPAMYGILPRFVKRSVLTSAIAVSSAYAQLAVFLGPAIAGWVISVFGVTVAFIINAVGYVIYLVSWLFLKTPAEFKKPARSENSVLRDVVDGVRYIFNHKGISSILIMLLAGDTVGAAVFYMAPAFSDQILGMGVVGVSLILASKGLGATLAAVWIAYGGEKMITPMRMSYGFLVFVLSVFAIFLFENLYLLSLSFVAMGMAAESYHTTMTSLVQLSVTEEQRGRVMGTLFMFAQFASGLGTYLVGYYAVSYGLAGPTLVAASICLVVWLYYFARRKQITRIFKESVDSSSLS